MCDRTAEATKVLRCLGCFAKVEVVLEFDAVSEGHRSLCAGDLLGSRGIGPWFAPVTPVYSGNTARTSAAASVPDLTAPSIYPFQTAECSAPAKWIRPTFWRRAVPYAVQTPGVKWAP